MSRSSVHSRESDGRVSHSNRTATEAGGSPIQQPLPKTPSASSAGSLRLKASSAEPFANSRLSNPPSRLSNPPSRRSSLYPDRGEVESLHRSVASYRPSSAGPTPNLGTQPTIPCLVVESASGNSGEGTAHLDMHASVSSVGFPTRRSSRATGVPLAQSMTSVAASREEEPALLGGSFLIPDVAEAASTHPSAAPSEHYASAPHSEPLLPAPPPESPPPAPPPLTLNEVSAQPLVTLNEVSAQPLVTLPYTAAGDPDSAIKLAVALEENEALQGQVDELQKRCAAMERLLQDNTADAKIKLLTQELSARAARIKELEGVRAAALEQRIKDTEKDHRIGTLEMTIQQLQAKLKQQASREPTTRHSVKSVDSATMAMVSPPMDTRVPRELGNEAHIRHIRELQDKLTKAHEAILATTSFDHDDYAQVYEADNDSPHRSCIRTRSPEEVLQDRRSSVTDIVTAALRKHGIQVEETWMSERISGNSRLLRRLYSDYVLPSTGAVVGAPESYYHPYNEVPRIVP